MNERFDIKTLSELTQVSVRTIRYYLAEGLLPPPPKRGSGSGAGAGYGPGHRDRLRLIRRLQDAHQPLAAIRAQLDQLDDAGVAQALAGAETPAAPPATTSARDYVSQILSAPPTTSHAEQVARVLTTSRASEPMGLSRSHWERLTLQPGLELHVRRPLSRADQRRLEALLNYARDLFALSD